jgi:hypothetical protein
MALSTFWGLSDGFSMFSFVIYFLIQISFCQLFQVMAGTSCHCCFSQSFIYDIKETSQGQPYLSFAFGFDRYGMMLCSRTFSIKKPIARDFAQGQEMKETPRKPWLLEM